MRSVIIVVCAWLVACGGGHAATGDGAASCGMTCGSACCAVAREVCVDDPASGAPTCMSSCTTKTDCSTGCCAPLADGSGNLAGPYVCQDSGKCCFDSPCGASTCCVTDELANEFCATPCTDSGTCGGSSTCRPYVFGESATCAGPMACGPAMGP